MTSEVEQRLQEKALMKLQRDFWKVIKVKPRDFQDTPEMWKLYATRVCNRFAVRAAGKYADRRLAADRSRHTACVGPRYPAKSSLKTLQKTAHSERGLVSCEQGTAGH